MTSTSTMWAFETYVQTLPDFAHYANAGVMTADAELLEAAAAHREVVDRYRSARVDLDEAKARLSNASLTDAKALAEAIERGADTDELNAIVGKTETEAKTDVERAAAIVAAFREPVLNATYRVMLAGVAHREQSLSTVREELDRREAKVEAAQRKLNEARNHRDEAAALVRWLTEVTGRDLPSGGSGMLKFDTDDE